MMVLVGGMMVLLLAEDGSGIGGGVACDGAALGRAALSCSSSWCVQVKLYLKNAIASLAKRGGSRDLSLSLSGQWQQPW